MENIFEQLLMELVDATNEYNKVNESEASSKEDVEKALIKYHDAFEKAENALIKK